MSAAVGYLFSFGLLSVLRGTRAASFSPHSATKCAVYLPRFVRGTPTSQTMAIHSPRHTRRLYSAASDDTHGTSPSDDVPCDTPPAEAAATLPGVVAAVPLSSAEEAAAVVATCLELMRERRLDELVSYVPDEVIDRCLQRRKLRAHSTPADAKVTFEDVLRQASMRDFYLDTFAMRALVFEPPRSIQVMSSMALDDSSFRQRCAVVAASGEASIITFAMKRVETLEPQFRGLRLVKRWVLASVTGESDADEEGDGEGGITEFTPRPRLSPEVVVQMQLSALQCLNYDAVFAFASPGNQANTGPVRRFTRMLQSPTYGPLLGHESSYVVSTMQTVPRSAVVVVSIKPAEDGEWRGSGSGTDGDQLAYLWFLSLQGPGPNEGCWLTDAVQLGAPELNAPSTSG